MPPPVPLNAPRGPTEEGGAREEEGKREEKQQAAVTEPRASNLRSRRLEEKQRPPEIVKITALNAATGREESIFAFADEVEVDGDHPPKTSASDNVQTFNKIVNHLVYDAPLDGASVGAPPISAAAAAAAAAGRPKQVTKSLRSAVEASFGKRFRSSSFAFSPSPSGPDSNLLIFLAGSGETSPSNNFLALGKTMALPQTAVLSVVGAHALPFDLGNCWYHEMDYDTGDALPPGSPALLSSLSSSISLLMSCLSDLSSSLPGTPLDSLEHVFLFGYSSGACLAAEVAHSLASSNRPPLGGVVCVRGCLLPSLRLSASPPSPTTTTPPVHWSPLLLLLGDCDDRCPPKLALEATIPTYGGGTAAPHGLVTARTTKGAGHDMIKDPNESRALFEFLSPKIRKIVCEKMMPSL